MKVKVKVHANSSQEKVLRISDDIYEVWTMEKPVEGRANARLIKILKKHFGKDVELVSGHKGRNKIVEVLE